MQYVIRTVNENNETIYYRSSGCTIYCPELATKYKAKKNALSVKSYLINEKGFTNVEIVEFSDEIVSSAHEKYKNKGEEFVKTVLDNIDES